MSQTTLYTVLVDPTNPRKPIDVTEHPIDRDTPKMYFVKFNRSSRQFLKEKDGNISFNGYTARFDFFTVDIDAIDGIIEEGLTLIQERQQKKLDAEIRAMREVVDLVSDWESTKQDLYNIRKRGE